MSSGDSPPDTGLEAPLVASVVPLIPAWRVDMTFDYLVGDGPSSLEVGSLVRVPFGHRKVRAVVVDISRRREERPLEAIGDPVILPAVCPPPMPGVLDWIARRYCVPRGAAYERVVPPRVRVKFADPGALLPRGSPERLPTYRGGPELLESIASGRAGAWCMQALPGEPAGTIVAELVSAAARPGSAALVAVPEVRYGSLVLERMAREWPDVARVDSSRSPADRARSWLRLAAGHGLGAGGRGVVLAPSPGLTLLVVDEEHHLSYKESRSPRYDARRVALERARRQGAVCVLVSSSPSIEIAYEVRRGNIRLVAPSREAARGVRPVVEVVARPTDRVLSRPLHARISAALAQGRRAALLVPARGYARAVWCSSCHRSLRCPRCETGLVLDRGRRPGGASIVRCPRCSHAEPAPDACPRCGASELRFMGAGSERLEEQVRRAWPRASVRRADPDVIDEDSAAAAPPDIYVTTWAGTKAVLRPDVSVVGVMDADALIRRPDFRSGENAYRALAEMAEWAGPASRGGRLVVQCSEPGHHAIQAVVRADYGFWLDRELEQRRELNYPPFSELVSIRATGSRRGELLETAADRCRRLGATVLGPVPSAARGSHPSDALELLVKCADANDVAEELRGILKVVPPGNRLSVDVDPR